MSTENPLVKYKNWAEKNPILATSVEVGATYITKCAIEKIVCSKTKINITNAMIEHHENDAIRSSVSKALFKAVVLAPVVEELVFRATTNVAAKKANDKNHTKIAIVLEQGSDVLFGLAHAGFVKPDENRKPKLDLKPSMDTHALPLVPYVSGKEYRRIGKKRGLGYGIYAHGLNNFFEVVRRAPRILRQKDK